MTRRRFLVGVPAALLGIAALATWLSLALVTLGSTSVTADATAIECRSGETGTFRFAEDEPSLATLEMAPGLDCDLRFVVTNNGPVAVHLTYAELPFLGDGSGLAVHATQLNGIAAEPSNGTRDAVVDLDAYVVAPGASLVLVTGIAYDNGCNIDGSVFRTAGLPVISLNAQGVSGEARPPLPQFGFEGTVDTDCS